MIKVEVDNSDWMEVSLTPEIYYLLSDEDRSELEDPRTRKKVLNKLESLSFFEHEELSQLELFLVREDRKREQERELKSANLELGEKHAVIQRFLQRKTTREEEEDERIREREVREAIEENEEEEVDEAETLRRAEQFLIRMAALAILERRLEEARERLGEGGGARVEEVDSSDEDDDSSDENQSESLGGTTSATSTIASHSRNRTNMEDNPDAIHTQPGRGSGRSSKRGKKNSTPASGGEGGDGDQKEDKKKKKKGCMSGFWSCITCCFG